MSNPLLTTTHSKLDTRVKEPSGFGSPTLERFSYFKKIKQLLDFERFQVIRFDLKDKDLVDYYFFILLYVPRLIFKKIKTKILNSTPYSL